MQKLRIPKIHGFQVRRLKPTHFNATAKSMIETNRVINELSKSGRVDEARKLFDKMPERDEYAWNTMIAGYANSGRLNEAKQLFSETSLKSSVTWSSLISGYCKYGLKVEAFELFSSMRIEGQRPSQYTLGSIVKLCASTGFVCTGVQVHGYTTKVGLDRDVFVVTSLVDMYAKCCCILAAEFVFEISGKCKNHATWTAMLSGYVHNGRYFEGIECFRDMRCEGVDSNQFTFPSVLIACSAVSKLDFGVQVHCCVIRSGFSANIFVQSATVDMYAKCGDLSSAKRALDYMDVDDAISWNSMIVGCARQGFHDEVLSFFRRMHSSDMEIDEYAYPSVLNSLAAVKDMHNAESVHCLTVKTGFSGYVLVNNALIDMFAKQGKLDCAVTVFDLMEDRDVVSWTSLITGYSYNSSYDEAINIFRKMRTEGIYPDQIIIASVLSACAELTTMELGQQVHSIVVKFHLDSSLTVANSLISMYAQCGSIMDANCVFDSMQTRDVISWTAVIVGSAKNGRGKASLQFYDHMIAHGTKPDYITFIGLLFACSHAGLVENGRHYFQLMDKVYGIKPGPEHYACMIDLFGRAGRLDEAKELLSQMVVQPDATVWKALLGACRVHGELELGEIAAKNLFELEPFNSLPYVMLSNIYSAAGRWEDVARIRGLMKSRGISKEPGHSWIETNGKVHRFMSEDREHHSMTEIYAKIDEIILLIREAGYIPDKNFALHNMDDEAKELGLAYHSEKLAVAYALLTVPQGAPIRIFKNLRVCGDCHNAMKYISTVYSCHIVLRDSNCFHHFKDGNCSCGDYW